GDAGDPEPVVLVDSEPGPLEVPRPGRVRPGPFAVADLGDQGVAGGFVELLQLLLEERLVESGSGGFLCVRGGGQRYEAQGQRTRDGEVSAHESTLGPQGIGDHTCEREICIPRWWEPF